MGRGRLVLFLSAAMLVAAAAIGLEARTATGLQSPAGFSLDGLEGGDKLRALVAAVVARQRAVHTLRAEFTQLKRSELLLEPVESVGVFAFRAPGTVRWDYTAPESMVVLLVDNLLTTLVPGRRRAEAVKLSGRHRKFVGALAGTQPLDELSQSFSITLVDPGGSGPYRLTLRPTHSVVRKKLKSVVLDIDRELLLPVVVECNEADGDTTRYEFRHLELNPKLDDSLFRLDLSGDVQVDEIDASGGVG